MSLSRKDVPSRDDQTRINLPKIVCYLIISPRLLVILFATVTCCFYSLTAKETVAAEITTEEFRQFSFAESLFAEKDYYRAIGEYKRYIFMFPQGTNAVKAHYRIAESYYRAEKWQEAADAFKQFVNDYPSSDLSDDALYFQGRVEKYLNRYDDAYSIFKKLSEQTTGFIHDQATTQMALVLVEKEDWRGARKLFSEINKSSSLYPAAQIYYNGLGEIDNLPQKSPEVAGMLAALLPGAGHLYTERPRDATIAFLLNASFIAAAIELFDHGDDVAGGIALFFELGWYTGNVYSAVSSAYKYNQQKKKEFLEELLERSGLSAAYGGHDQSYNLMYSFYY